MGKFGLGGTQHRCLKLAEFAQNHPLTIPSTLHPQEKSRTATWHSAEGSVHQQIDFILHNIMFTTKYMFLVVLILLYGLKRRLLASVERRTQELERKCLWRLVWSRTECKVFAEKIKQSQQKVDMKVDTILCLVRHDECNVR